MRKLALLILVPGLAVVSAAWAAAGTGDAVPAADKPAATNSASLPDAPKPAATPAESATAATAPATTTAASSALESELAELRALLHAQAAELEAQRHELAEMKAKLAAPAAAPAASPAAPDPAATAVITSAPSTKNGPELGPGAWVDGRPPGEESPLALHYKGITLTPGGFAAAESVYRNRAVNSDVNTPFTSVPFGASNDAHISELNFSGRQSRISMVMEGKLANVKIGSYYEGDFLASGVTSNSRQSNSYVFRQRQFWAQAQFNSGWTITGGQMWSLVTETRKGMDNRTEAIPLTIDAQYEAGFNWARQYGFRITKNFSDKFWLGFSVEDAQDTGPTVHNNASNFLVQGAGNLGGLDNNQTNYTLNATPDFIFKAAWEPGWGHYELYGLVRTFRTRDYPCIVPAGVTAPADCTGVPNTSFANNDTRAGGGIGGGFRVPIFNKKVDIGLKGLYGDGVARYGSSTLADLTIRPVGTPAPLHSGSFLSTIEWHATPKLDIYGYYGGDYNSRGYYVTVAGTPTVPPVSIGYGSPFFVNSGCESPTEVAPAAGGLPSTAGNCTADIRTSMEGTIGFWHRLYKGDRGTMQWGLQYSYVRLSAWSGLGTPGVAGVFPQFNPHANDSMFFSSLRYYLP